jgi:hypothetical protein
MFRFALRRALALAALMVWAAGPAAAAYITDKLMVGVQQQPGASGEPARLVQGGTPVEVIGRSADHLEVRLPDGATGWVETRFVTDDRPTSFLLVEAQAGKAALERELAELGERGTQPPPVVTVPPPAPATNGWGGWWLLPFSLLLFAAGYIAGGGLRR